MNDYEVQIGRGLLIPVRYINIRRDGIQQFGSESRVMIYDQLPYKNTAKSPALLQ